jgi:hypothetical protein
MLQRPQAVLTHSAAGMHNTITAYIAADTVFLFLPKAPLLLPPPLLLLPSSLQAMYYDRKKQLIEQGKWFDDPDK